MRNSKGWLLLLVGVTATGWLWTLPTVRHEAVTAAPLAQATATNTLTPTVTTTPTVTPTPTRTPNPADAVFHFQGAEAVGFRAVHNGDGTYSLSVVVVTPVP